MFLPFWAFALLVLLALLAIGVAVAAMFVLDR